MSFNTWLLESKNSCFKIALTGLPKRSVSNHNRRSWPASCDAACVRPGKALNHTVTPIDIVGQRSAHLALHYVRRFSLLSTTLS